MFFKIFSDTFEGAFYLDHIFTVSYKDIFVKVISVTVKMKTDKVGYMFFCLPLLSYEDIQVKSRDDPTLREDADTSNS